jgi:hypothetical protein
MTCRCQGHLHDPTCACSAIASRYNDIYLRAHRRYIRRELACNATLHVGNLADPVNEPCCDLKDEAWELRANLGALWIVASSPQLLRRLVSDLAAGQWKETGR